jgi:hypothetical protein
MPFRAILDTLVDAHAPAVRGAVFCDHEGERIDACCGDLTPFELDVVGASFAAAVEQLNTGTQLRLVAEDAYWIVVVAEGCYLVVVCRRGHDHACKADLPSISSALAAYM